MTRPATLRPTGLPHRLILCRALALSAVALSALWLVAARAQDGPAPALGPLPAAFVTNETRSLATRFPALQANCPEAVRADRSAPSACDHLVVVIATNAGDTPVSALPPRISGLYRLGTPPKGGTGLDVAAADIPVTTDCTGVIAPGAFCTLNLYLPPDLPAGSYGLKYALQGKAGGLSSGSLTLNLRSPRWLVGLVVALGALVGLVISHWRSTDRAQSLAELPWRIGAEGLRPFRASAHGAVAGAAGRVLSLVDTTLLMWRQTRKAPSLQSEMLTTARTALAAAERALSAAAALSAPRQDRIEPARRALELALQQDDWAEPARLAAAALLAAIAALPADAARPESATGSGATGSGATGSGTRPTLDFDLPTGAMMARIDASLSETLAHLRRMDLLTNGAVLAVFWLLGALIPWPLSDGWDGFANLAAAFAAGLGLRMALPVLVPPKP